MRYFYVIFRYFYISLKKNQLACNLTNTPYLIFDVYSAVFCMALTNLSVCLSQHGFSVCRSCQCCCAQIDATEKYTKKEEKPQDGSPPANQTSRRYIVDNETGQCLLDVQPVEICP